MKNTVKLWIIIAGFLIFSVVVGGNIGVAFDLVILLLLCLILPLIWGMKLIARWFGADLDAKGQANGTPNTALPQSETTQCFRCGGAGTETCYCCNGRGNTNERGEFVVCNVCHGACVVSCRGCGGSGRNL